MKGILAMPGGPLQSKPTWLEHLLRAQPRRLFLSPAVLETSGKPKVGSGSVCGNMERLLPWD